MQKCLYKPSPWETIEGIAKSAAKPVKKAVADVGSDVKESLSSSLSSGDEGKKQISAVGQEKAAEEQQRILVQTRQNLQEMNAQVKKAREERRHRQEQAGQAAQAKKAEKKKQAIEEKKKETVLQKLLRSRGGTREGIQRAGG